jgi:mRNA interferase RelE/StbE
MIYKLTFLKTAKKEWDKLAEPIKKQFKTKLEKRLIEPHIQKDALHTLKSCYKIKLRSVGYRLVYKVIEDKIVIQVIAVGKRNNMDVYKLAHKRIH